MNGYALLEKKCGDLLKSKPAFAEKTEQRWIDLRIKEAHVYHTQTWALLLTTVEKLQRNQLNDADVLACIIVRVQTSLPHDPTVGPG